MQPLLLLDGIRRDEQSDGFSALRDNNALSPRDAMQILTEPLTQLAYADCCHR